MMTVVEELLSQAADAVRSVAGMAEAVPALVAPFPRIEWLPSLSQAAGPKARSLSELEAAGVCSATFPSIALFAAANAVRNVLRVLKRSDTLAPLDDLFETLVQKYPSVLSSKVIGRRRLLHDRVALCNPRIRRAFRKTY